MTHAPLLEMSGVTVRFGGIVALHQFDLALQTGELVGLIGPNGAGKTTVFNTITGICQPNSGEVRFDAASLIGLPTHRIIARGIARTFQNIRLFRSMSVRENVSIGCRAEFNYGPFSALIRCRRMRASEVAIRDRCDCLLASLDLTAWADAPAATLPYGLQRRLEIARALATRPRVLLLDEPAAGMSSCEKADLATRISHLRADAGLTILLIDHDMPFVMGLCSRVVAIDRGQVIANESPELVRADKRVIAAYLGDDCYVGSK